MPHQLNFVPNIIKDRRQCLKIIILKKLLVYISFVRMKYIFNHFVPNFKIKKVSGRKKHRLIILHLFKIELKFVFSGLT